ncbi:6-bladed beta-propeller [Puteibacter caeruleilacunae]|nr:6-bladed beta-propeller [Puteibacter caeruleilacunae]
MRKITSPFNKTNTMKQLILVLCILSLTFTAFADDKEKTTLKMLDNVTTLDDITTEFDEFEYTPLETTAESIIGRITKLIPTNDNLFILDASQRKCVLIFSRKGKFIRTIGRKGAGPGEYKSLNDFTIDEQRKQIIMLTDHSTLMIYDFEGQFIRKKKLTSSAHLYNIGRYNNGYICSANHQSVLEGDEAYLLFNYDRDFNLKGKIGEVLPLWVSIPSNVNNPILTDQSGTVFFDSFTNQIYINPEDKSKTKTIALDFDGNAIPTELYADYQKLFPVMGKYSFFTETACLVDHTVYCSFVNKKFVHLALIDLDNMQVKSFKRKWFPRILSHENGTLFASMRADVIANGHDFFKAKSTNNYKVTIESNPVIVTFKKK